VGACLPCLFVIRLFESVLRWFGVGVLQPDVQDAGRGPRCVLLGTSQVFASRGLDGFRGLRRCCLGCCSLICKLQAEGPRWLQGVGFSGLGFSGCGRCWVVGGSVGVDDDGQEQPVLQPHVQDAGRGPRWVLVYFCLFVIRLYERVRGGLGSGCWSLMCMMQAEDPGGRELDWGMFAGC
jgi:hypothetical protein